MDYRIEKDFLGSKKINKDACWGIHTQRALENFKISGYKSSKGFISAFAMVKKACAMANCDLGYLDKQKSEAVIAACNEIIDGKLHDQFPLDAMQGGAGTSTNMNVNEVIANRAIEILGGEKGDYSLIHPLEDINLHQSTNDTYPTALKVAAIILFNELSEEIAAVQGAFQKKEKEFSEIITVARTELREAVPVTLGAEFSSFAEAFARDRWRTFKCIERLRVVNLGGTAVGTGLGAPRSYIFLVIEKLREITGLSLCRGENLMDQTANADAFVEVSGIIKAYASNIIKICNDLRILQLCGEIKLPELQAGSSIMPGKINPVVLEAAMQSGLKVMANDFLVAEASSRGTLQINEFLPLLGFSLLESLEILIHISRHISEHVCKIEADKDICWNLVRNSISTATAFIPYAGYDKVSEWIKELKNSEEKDLRAFLEKKMGKSRVEDILSPQNLISLGYRENERNT